jgi:superfamily II DNA/RNA helicase
MPQKIRELSKKILNAPASISLEVSKPAAGVLQAAYLVNDSQKIELIRKLISEKPNYQSILIFTATKKRVNEIANALRRHGMQVEGISSNLEQAEREAVLLRFRARKTRILVATDVMSRGIDIKEINLIINYDVPNDAEDYVHRVGRTARADTTGVAITLVNPADRYKLDAIERLIDKKINKIKLPAMA